MRRFFESARIVIFGLAVGALHQTAIAQPLVLSERLGVSVSWEERAYFGLFPSILNFESASFIADTGGYVRLEIQRGDEHANRTFLLPDSLYSELCEYINAVDYETEPDQALLQKLGTLVDEQNKRWNAPKTQVKLTSGRTIRGRLFSVDSSAIGLIGIGGPYSPSDLNSLRQFTASELDVVSTGSNHLTLGAGIGLAVGAAAGLAIGASNIDRGHAAWGAEPVISMVLLGALGLVAGGMGGLIASDDETVAIRGNSGQYADQLPKLQSMALHKAMPPELKRQ